MKTTTHALMTFLLVLMLAACQSREQPSPVPADTADAVDTTDTAGTGTEQATDEEAATLLGAEEGAGAAYFIGGQLGEEDRQQIAETLENQPLGETVTWTSSTSGARYQLTPIASFERDGQPCRRFELSFVDRASEVDRIACRTDDEGNWHLAD